MLSKTISKLVKRDQQSIWHPYTQHKSQHTIRAITRGEGAYVFDENGTSYLDLISSWWVNLHGHGHPVIAQAIYEQALKLEHIIFAGFTHEPAVCLAERLIRLLPGYFQRAFYSDNGSTAIEVALKLAYQAWRNKGEFRRVKFLCFEGCYHGDTFGSMALGKGMPFFKAFEDLFFEVIKLPYLATYRNDDSYALKESRYISLIEEIVEKNHSELCAFVLEPMVQGASGMRMTRPSFLNKVMKLVKEKGIIIIFDEVMTGFGRAGEMFAANYLSIHPDILCLAKGITGGFLPLAVTLTTEDIFQKFCSDDASKTFFHGHSYTANPLACAAALASLNLLELKETQENIKSISTLQADFAAELTELPGYHAARALGTICAFEEIQDINSDTSIKLNSENFYKAGLLLRPLGNTLYLMPPYCIKPDDLKDAHGKILTILKA